MKRQGDIYFILEANFISPQYKIKICPRISMSLRDWIISIHTHKKKKSKQSLNKGVFFKKKIRLNEKTNANQNRGSTDNASVTVQYNLHFSGNECEPGHFLA